MTTLLNRLFPAFILLFGLWACNNSSITTNEKSEDSIPTLIDRSDKIRHDKEWDQVQNVYVAKKLALQKNPRNHEAAITLAELFILEARVTGEHGHYYPAALEMTNQVINDSEIEADMAYRARVTKAGVQLSLHEFSEALTTAKEALALNPYNAQIYGVLVDCYVELGQYDKAIIMADKMISIKPDIRSYSRISYLREVHGQVDGAIEAMSMAIRAGYPGYEETAWAMLTLGNLYQEYGELDKAEKIYQQILDTRNDYPFAISAQGEIALKKGDIEAAEKKFLAAMDIIPEIGFYTSMAKIYKARGENEKFEKIMKEVFAMLKDDVDSGHNMNLEYADIYLDFYENPQKALEYAQREYNKRPNNIDVNRMMAKVYLSLDDKQAAVKHYEVASSTKSSHPELQSIKDQI